MCIMPTSAATALALARMRRRKTQPGSTGSAALRSTSPKTAITAAPPPSTATLVQERQAQP